jgi:uncharacterized protein involved in exopolysaccharide biosynthesis
MGHGVIGSGRPATAQDGWRPPELSVFDRLRIVYKYRWVILPVCCLAAGITGAACYFSRPTYTSMASIVSPLELLQGQTSLGMGLLGAGNAALLRQVMDVATVTDAYVGILESRVVLDTLVQKFDLANQYDVGGAVARARARLRARTTLKATKEGIVYVTVQDEDRARAAALANAYVQELDQQNKRLSGGQATSKRIFLESRLQEVEQTLSRIDSIPSQEARVQEMLYELLMREYEIAKIEEAKSLPTIQVLDRAVPAEERDPRGTIRKAALAGLVALVGMIFFAFGREYVAEYRLHLSTLPSGASRSQGPQERAGRGREYDGDSGSDAEEQTHSRERRHEVMEGARP